jgi:Fe-S-cluster containining protein
MSKKDRRRALDAKLDALYARLPALTCQGRCSQSCGPIIAADGEIARMKRAHPERHGLRTVPVMCGYLTPAGRCNVYAARPLICRVFGLVKRMSCPHGCVPERWLTDHEFVALAVDVEAVAGPFFLATPEGVESLHDSFARLQATMNLPTARPPEEVEYYAEQTLGLRAIHGGRILGVGPGEGAASYVDLDALRRTRRDSDPR